MAEIEFSNNYNDLSVPHGVDAGFQFEFSCQRCADAWRSEFVPYRGAQLPPGSKFCPECGHKAGS